MFFIRFPLIFPDEENLRKVRRAARTHRGAHLIVALELVEESAFSLVDVQTATGRVYLAALEGDLNCDITVIPPRPGVSFKDQIAHIVHIAKDISSEDPDEQLDGDFEYFPKYGDVTQVNGDTFTEPLPCVCLGGTFDRLHPGHKLMLSLAAIVTKKMLIVGLADGPLLEKKKLRDLIQPFEVRKEGVLDFFRIVSPKLDVRVEPLHDPVGPAGTMAELEGIVVSSETVPGARKINDTRAAKNMGPLFVFGVSCLPPPRNAQMADGKLSSTAFRSAECEDKK